MPSRLTPGRLRLIVGGGVGLALAAVGLYGTGWLTRNSADPDCAASRAAVARMGPLARGELAAFQVATSPEPAPAIAITAPDGTSRTLADFRGRTLVLNLWATWCEPCRREMPALDRLQANFGGPAFEVVAVNIDTRNLDRPKAWLETVGVSRLAYYADKEAKIFQDLRRAGQAEGMPTTLIIDGRGCRLGTLAGPAEWSSKDGFALVKAAIGG